MSAYATIRVPSEIRDLLAALALEHGISVSALLTEFARRSERSLALSSEREATRADAADGDVAAEERFWESAIGDGVG